MVTNQAASTIPSHCRCKPLRRSVCHSRLPAGCSTTQHAPTASASWMSKASLRHVRIVAQLFVFEHDILSYSSVSKAHLQLKRFAVRTFAYLVLPIGRCFLLPVDALHIGTKLLQHIPNMMSPASRGQRKIRITASLGRAWLVVSRFAQGWVGSVHTEVRTYQSLAICVSMGSVCVAAHAHA